MSNTGQIEFALEHTTASGDMMETLINVEFVYTRGSPGGRYDPPETPEWDYVRSSYRDETGIWRPIATGDFLDLWAQARFAACEADEIEACIPSAAYPAIAE